MGLLGSVCAWCITVDVLSPTKEAAPGTFVTHVFAVANPETDALTAELLFDAPPGWGVLGAPSTVSIPAQGEEPLFVTLTIPAEAAAGEHLLLFSAISTEDPSDTASGEARTLVTAVNRIEVVPPTEQRLSPGSVADYAFTLINRGNAQEVLDISISSSRGYDAAVSPSGIVELAPGERRMLSVRLTIPADAEPGRDVLIFEAVSNLHAGVEDRAEVFTTVLPPPPEAVGGSLMEELPARLRLSIDKDVVTGRFDSQLSFSVSGRVLDGYFSSFVNASDPLGPDPVTVGSYSLLYRREPATYSIGKVSARPTDLIALSCEGASIVIDGEILDLTLIGGGTDDDTRYAGAIAIGPEVANLGLTYLDIRTETSRRAIWGATAATEPLEGWTMRLEGGLGLDGPLTSRAFFFNTTLDVDGYFLTGDVFSIGTYFPGSGADSAGILLSQRLRIDDLSLSLSLGHEWDNVVNDPLETTTIVDELGFNLVTSPIEDGPTVSSTFEFEWTREPNTANRSELDTLASFGFSESGGVFPYAFSGKAADRIDHVLGTHSRTWTFREGVGLSIDSFYLFLQLTQERHIDLITDTVLASGSDVSLLFRPEGTLHEASINLRNDHDAFDLSASLFIRVTDDVDLVFAGSIEWDRGDAEDLAFGWGIALNANLDIPLPFLRTKGRIEGRLFIDVNGNGLYDLVDRPVAGAVVSADRSEVSTNEEGLFRFYPFYAGSYELEASELPIDAVQREALAVDLEAGETVWIDLPLAPVTVITGVLFEDGDQDAVQQEDEGGFEGIRILLSDASGDIADTMTTSGGAFRFVDLLAGAYTVTVDRNSLPDRFSFTTPGDAVVQAAADTSAPIAFGGFIRPRDVIITFQPPTADFLVDPEMPTAGEPARFDGTFSFDFDGEILFYAWDFDADGEPDATSEIVDYTFTEAGSTPVSLTVTDDGGNVDTVTLVIEVQPGAVVPEAPATPEVADTVTPPTQPDDPGTDGTVQLPIAEFAYAPEQPVAGLPVFFDASASSDPDGEISAYAWDFDNDGAADAEGPSVARTFATAGPLVVQLTVTDNDGNRDSLSIEITVLSEAPAPSQGTFQPPIADFVFSPQDPAPGVEVLFDAALSIDPDGSTLTYAWDFDADGQIDATTVSASHAFAESGEMPVSLTVTDAEGNTDTLALTVLVAGDASAASSGTFQPPIAGFEFAPLAPEVGEPVTFDGSVSFDFDGEIVSYGWDFDQDGQIDATEAVVVFAFDVAGDYTVSLTVTDSSGSTDTVAYSVPVSALGPTPAQTLQPPIADFSYAPAGPETGAPVSFDGTLSFDFDGTITAYAWDFDADGQIDSFDAIAYHTFTTPGAYPVRLTVTDNGGNTDTVEYLLQVAGEAMDGEVVETPPDPSPSILPPVADFTFMPQSPLAGELVMFNASESFDPDGTIVSYAWDFDGDGVIDATEPISVTTFPSPDIHEVSLTVTDNDGNTDTFTAQLSIE